MAEGGERRGKQGSAPVVGQSVGQSAAELAEAILGVIERGGRHAWVQVVELCARAKRGEPTMTTLDLDRAGAASPGERAAG